MVRFRSWNKEKSRFYYFVDGRYYTSDSCAKGTCVSERLCSEFSWKNAECATMYCNKDQTEFVYEGDILEWRNACGVDDGFGYVEYNEEDMTMFVSNDEEGDMEELQNVITNCVCIGNIHENEKLANKIKD